MSIRVLLADDQALVRGGLRKIVETEPDMVVVAEAAANSWISRRVIDGASSASPPATTRMPSASCSGGTSLSRKPLAPARSAS